MNEDTVTDKGRPTEPSLSRDAVVLLTQGDEDRLRWDMAAISDRREDMTVSELAEELELRFPEKVAEFERRHNNTWESALYGDVESCDPDEIDDLRDDMVTLLRI